MAQRPERAIEKQKDDCQDEWQKHREPLLGAGLIFELPAPDDRIQHRVELDVARKSLVRVFEKGRQIAAAEVELDREVPLVRFAGDGALAALELHLRHLRKRDARPPCGRQRQVADVLGAAADRLDEADRDVVFALPEEELGDRLAADNPLFNQPTTGVIYGPKGLALVIADSYVDTWRPAGLSDRERPSTTILGIPLAPQ